MVKEPQDTPMEIGNWRLHISRNLLFHKTLGEVVLRPKVAEVLQVLMTANGSLVSREELIESVWEGNQYVGERGVNDAIWQLRKVLDQDELAPYIETIPKKGYRLPINARTSIGTNGHSFLPIALTLAILTCLVIGTLFWRPHEPSNNQTSVQALPIPLSTMPGNESSPKFSPDGRYVTYTHSPIQGGFELHLVDLKNQSSPYTPIILPTGGSAGFGTFSGDSKEVMYFTQAAQGECDVRILSLITRQHRKAFECELGALTGLDWSPDGRYAALGGHHVESSSILIRLHNLENNTSSWLTSPPNTGVANDLSMRFSPDGKQLAFVRSIGVSNADIFITDIQGNLRKVTELGASIAGVDWLDQDNLLFAHIESNKSQLKKLNLNSGEITYALPGETDSAFPDYSITTNQLVYKKRSMAKKLQTIDLTPETNVARVRTMFSSPSMNHYPNYSKQHQSLAFVSDRSGFDELWLMDASGQKLTQITSLQTQVFSPAWSPDGRYIAFTASPKPKTFKQIFIYEVATKKLRQITTNDTDHAPPTWSADSKSLYYGVHEKDGFFLWHHPLNGAPKKFMEQPAIYGFEHPLNDNFLYTEMTTGGIWQHSRETGKSNRIIETNSRVDGSNWIVTPEGLYFVMRGEDNDVVNFYDFETKSQETIIMLPKRSIASFDTIAYIQDKNQLVFVQNIMQEADIYLVDNFLSN